MSPHPMVEDADGNQLIPIDPASWKVVGEELPNHLESGIMKDLDVNTEHGRQIWRIFKDNAGMLWMDDGRTPTPAQRNVCPVAVSRLHFPDAQIQAHMLEVYRSHGFLVAQVQAAKTTNHLQHAFYQEQLPHVQHIGSLQVERARQRGESQLRFSPSEATHALAKLSDRPIGITDRPGCLEKENEVFLGACGVKMLR